VDSGFSKPTPLSSGRWGVRSGPGSWDRGLRTFPLSSYRSGTPHMPMRARHLGMASAGPDPPGGPAPPRVGASPLWACLSSWPRGPGPPYFLREGVRCRHVPPRWRLLDRPCHVPVAESPLRDVGPTTALNADRWAARTQVKAWSTQLTPR
jgi:hypothetical protein